MIDGAKLHAAEPGLNKPPSDGAQRPETAGQRDLREERCARRADVRVGREQILLGFHDVRTTRQQIGRQARRNIRQQVLVVERHARRQIVRQRLAEQQHQRVIRLSPQTRLRLQVGVRLLDHRLRLPQIQFRTRAVVELQLGDPVRLLRGLQRVLRDLQQIVQLEHRHVLIRHLRDQRDFRGLARLSGSQVLSQRLILQALNPPEEVDFPGRIQADRIRRS